MNPEKKREKPNCDAELGEEALDQVSGGTNDLSRCTDDLSKTGTNAIGQDINDSLNLSNSMVWPKLN